MTTRVGSGRGAVSSFIVANPLVSRNKPSFTCTGLGAALSAGLVASAGRWSAGLPTPAAPAWLAIQVGVGPKRALLRWTASGKDYSDAHSGAPAAYRIETSADSTNGADGAWRVEVTVTGNAVRTRAHSFELDGQSWVRLTITEAAPGSQGISIDQLNVHDASDGTDDTWFCLGDSAMAFAFERDPHTFQSFAEHIYERYPGYFPAVINGSIRGERSADGLARLSAVLERNPDVCFFAISYGSDEARGSPSSPAQFRANLGLLIGELVAAGRVPVLARIPGSLDAQRGSVEAYNAVLDELTREHGLLPGPDLYSWFQAHPEQLDNRAQPSPEGRAAIQRLWADAMDPLYVPQ